ncbi:MAG TPA: D-alanyl-D-alanine carboxypeptidase/D-alanyl-D-alanine-endopeptidase [Acidimicrobiia bacterium]
MSARRGRARQHNAARRVLVGVLVVAGVAALAFAFRPGPEPAAGATSAPRLATALWSPRRVAEPFRRAVAAQRLQSDLTAAIGGTPSCVEVADSGGVVASVGPAGGQLPGSTQKLLTALTAVHVLGPTSTFTTRAVASGPPRNGTLQRLYLVGGGDPLLSTPERAAALSQDPETRGEATTSLAGLADAIVASGVRSIPGGIVADDHRYDQQRFSVYWPAHYVTDRETGAIGALDVNRGFGAPAGDGAAATDPALSTADQLARLLLARGVVVGPSSRGVAPSGALQIASVRSPPLTSVLAEMLGSSDNFTAEMLVKEIAVHSGEHGTTDNGVAVIRRTITGLGLPTQGWVMVDGSGLSRDDRVSCALLLGAIGLARTPQFASIAAGLPVAGRSGTLVQRLTGTDLDGVLRAKTGTLDGVTGLVGFIDLRAHVDFALLLNGGAAGTGTGADQRDRIALQIAGYPDAPPTEVLVPAPASPTERTS